MTVKGDAKFKEKLTRSLKHDIKNLVNFHESRRKPKNLHFDGLPLSKAYNVFDEKVQKSYVLWHWRVMQSLKRNWILVPNMTWGIWWILIRAVASLRIFTLMCYFCQKNTEEWYVITLKNDAKFNEGMTCNLKNDMRNLANFDPTLESFKRCTLMTKVYNVWAKKGQSSYAWYTEDQCKLWRNMQTLKKQWLVFWSTGALKILKTCTLRDFFVQGI